MKLATRCVKRPLVLWGASGHAKVLREFLDYAGFRLEAVFDNDPKTPPPFEGVPVYYGSQGFQDWREQIRGDTPSFLVAIGGDRGRERLEIQETLERAGLQATTVIHPTAFVAESASFGRGSQVLANAAICAEVNVGRSCIVNTAASVDHESTLEDGVHVAPGVTIAGCVHVGACSLIGPGAVVLPRVRIGENSLVGAGAVVTRDVPPGKVVYGVPARVVRANQ